MFAFNPSVYLLPYKAVIIMNIHKSLSLSIIHETFKYFKKQGQPTANVKCRRAASMQNQLSEGVA